MLNKLVRKGRMLPSSILLEDVSPMGAMPVTAGGFADIWQGRVNNGTIVALKVLRIFNQVDDLSTAFDVRFLIFGNERSD